MNIALLQEIIEKGYIYEELPDKWKLNKIVSFSEKKNLFPYQLEALKLAISCLFMYYEELKDYMPDEELYINEIRKKKLYDRYLNAGRINKDDLDIRNLKSNDYLIEIYEDYFDLDDNRISFGNLINRMSF